MDINEDIIRELISSYDYVSEGARKALMECLAQCGPLLEAESPVNMANHIAAEH